MSFFSLLISIISLSNHFIFNLEFFHYSDFQQYFRRLVERKKKDSYKCVFIIIISYGQ